MDFIEELQWRGLLADMTEGASARLQLGPVSGYVGFDPTADSLHIGNLVAIMLLVFLQRSGHKPIALIGGATGMVGDPSGKSEERNLLSPEIIRHNQECIKKQLSRFIDFSASHNAAEIVNNYDWFGPMGFLDFLRDVGKHLTVNYMMAKESVQRRLESGLSYTEFTYQLLQGYDFYWLYVNKQCVLQMGGSDQWGNITAGTELVRRMAQGEAYALTCPLLTRADGKKFGKSETGENIWLDPARTSPYKFYQFWLNTSDDDAQRFLKIFTVLSKERIDALIAEHAQAPHLRLLQRELAREVTIRVHSQADFDAAVETSGVLFGEGTTQTLQKLSTTDLLAVFEGLPCFSVSRTDVHAGIDMLEFLAVKTAIFSSKGEARRMVQSGGVSINKQKVLDEKETVTDRLLLQDTYLLVQRGKKNYFLVQTE